MYESSWLSILSISGYSTASTEDAAYIIGGHAFSSSTDFYAESSYVNTIAEFKNDQWRQLGNPLSLGRRYHGSITVGDQTMVIGGTRPAVTEVWTFADENHKTIDPTLPGGNYATGIALFAVTFDFCQWFASRSRGVHVAYLFLIK